MKNKLRREKCREKVKKNNEPISTLPDEKIRKDNIEQRAKEWLIYEAKWAANKVNISFL